MNGCTRRFLCGAVLLALPGAASAQRIIDGQNIPADNAGALGVATQRFQTGFGDNPGNRFSFGSELNQMFLDADATDFYIALTGNLENNGNGLIVFIETAPAGVPDPVLRTRPNGLGNPAFPRNLTGNLFDSFEVGLDDIAFDDGFFPNFALSMNGGSPVGSRTRTYYLVNWTTLVPSDPNDPGNTNEIAGLMTDGDATASGPAGTLGSFFQTSTLGIRGASDNSNGAGVTGGFPSSADPNLVGDPTSATTGFEFAIPLSLMGVGSCDEVKVFAIVTGTGGFLSNQMLPPPATESEYNNIGGGRPFSFATSASGDQFLSVTLPLAGDCDGDGTVGLGDLVDMLSNFASPTVGNCQGGLAGLVTVLSNFGQSCGS